MAQLQLAELHGQAGQDQADPVSAYMWYLIAETTAGSLCKQIEERKQSLIRTLSPRELEEAQRRADDRLKKQKKECSAGLGPVPTKTLTGVS